jgi:opacity protein-like surface antigen
MRWKNTLMVVAWICSGCLFAPALVFAEWFGDLYGGVAFPETTTATFDQRLPTPANATTTLSIGASPTAGIRVGKWLDIPYVGFALDVSYFQRRVQGARIDVVPISALLMLRSPLLTSEEFPKGQLQPYVAIGPSLFAANGSIDSPAPGIDAVNEGRTDFGFDVRAGVAWQINKYVAMFSEYRFTDVSLRFLHRECFKASCGPLETDIVSETRVPLATHHLLMGVRF